MFTGIIETLGTIKNVVKDQDNVHITIESEFTKELKIDQSVAHNGVCLTVINIENNEYTVWSSTQHPTEVQHGVSKVLNIPSAKIDSKVRRLGGGF